MGIVEVPMPEERRWYKDPVNWLTIAVLVGFALAVVTTPTFQSWLHSLWGSQPQQPAQPHAQQPTQQPRLFAVLIEADTANATALVNGSLHALPARLSVREGSTLVIEPQPTELYEPLNSTILLNVTGNVTVSLRYRRAYALVRVRAEYPLLVNGSLMRNDTVLSVRLNHSLSFSRTCLDAGNYTALCSDKIRVVRGNVTEEFPLNATLTFSEDAVVIAEGATLYVLEFRNVAVPVSVNGTVYRGDFRLYARLGDLLVVEPYRAARGCVDYDNQNLLCVSAWRVPAWLWLTGRLASPVLRFRVQGGGVVEMETAIVPRAYPVLEGEVYFKGEPVKARLEPDPALLVPIVGEYKYLGNGWWYAGGSLWAFLLTMPSNWTVAKVWLNFTGKVPSQMDIAVVKEDGHIKGIVFNPQTTDRIVCVLTLQRDGEASCTCYSGHVFWGTVSGGPTPYEPGRLQIFGKDVSVYFRVEVEG